MNIEFHPEAAEEFEAAVDWYEVREIGLGLASPPKFTPPSIVPQPCQTPGHGFPAMFAAYWSAAFPMVFCTNRGVRACSCWP
jgi:hypothetical protein